MASSASLMELERRKGTSHNCWELGRFSKFGVKTPHLFFFPSSFSHSGFGSLDCHLCSLLCFLHSSLPSLHFCFCVLETWSYCLILNNFPILMLIPLTGKRASTWRHLFRTRKFPPLFFPVEGEAWEMEGVSTNSFIYLHWPMCVDLPPPNLCRPHFSLLTFHYLNFNQTWLSIYSQSWAPSSFWLKKTFPQLFFLKFKFSDSRRNS